MAKDFFENVPHNKDAPSGRSFTLSRGVPQLREDMGFCRKFA